MGRNGISVANSCVLLQSRTAKRMASSFRAAGISATEYLGTTSLDERSKLIEKLQYGEIKVLCAVDVLNEGVDIPFVECLLFCAQPNLKGYSSNNSDVVCD